MMLILGIRPNSFGRRMCNLLNLNDMALYTIKHKVFGAANAINIRTNAPFQQMSTSNSSIRITNDTIQNKIVCPRRQLSSSVVSTNNNHQVVKDIPLTFYYDTISPYSWLAFEILQRYRPIWNLVIDFKPVFMGGITKENNNKFLESLTSTPNRVAYIFQDMVRTGEFYQVPLRVPESPLYLLGVAGSLKQQRFLTAVKRSYPEYLESCSREFWYRCWSEDLDASKDESIFMVATRAGLKEDEILDCLEDIRTDDLKNNLKETTSEAVKAGAFGLPFITVEREKTIETFWGSDRFEIMASSLGVQWHGPVPDYETFVPTPMAPGNFEQELFKTLEDIGAIKTDFSLPDSPPRSPPR